MGPFAELVLTRNKTFFRSGGSSGTIAKAMSAYDKDFSDAIYGRRRRTLRNRKSTKKMITMEIAN
jgi:hypothetical protein